jgi:hypothetical protein
MSAKPQVVRPGNPQVKLNRKRRPGRPTDSHGPQRRGSFRDDSITQEGEKCSEYFRRSKVALFHLAAGFNEAVLNPPQKPK